MSLEEELAYLYDSLADITGMLRRARLDLAYYNVTGTPINVWTEVVARARRNQGDLLKILQEALKQYPKRQVLLDAYKNEGGESETVTPSTAKATTVTPKSNLTPQERKHKEDIRNIKARNLRILEKQAAAYGDKDVPIYKVTEIEDLKKEIDDINEELDS